MKKSIIFLAFVLFLVTSPYHAFGTDYGPSRIDDDYVSNDNIIIDDEDKLDLTINSNNGPIYIRLPDGEPLFLRRQMRIQQLNMVAHRDLYLS